MIGDDVGIAIAMCDLHNLVLCFMSGEYREKIQFWEL